MAATRNTPTAYDSLGIGQRFNYTRTLPNGKRALTPAWRRLLNMHRGLDELGRVLPERDRPRREVVAAHAARRVLP